LKKTKNEEGQGKLIGKLLILYDLVIKKLITVLKALSSYVLAYVVLLLNAYFVYVEKPLPLIIVFAVFSSLFYVIVRITDGSKKV
jgi:hypothetical protein